MKSSINSRKSEIMMQDMALAAFEKSRKEMNQEASADYNCDLNFAEIKGQIDKKTAPRRIRKRMRVVAPIAAMITLFTCFFAVGESVRNLFSIVWNNDEHVEIRNQQVNGSEWIREQLPGWKGFYCAHYVPSGYVMDSKECQRLRDHTVIVFKNDHGEEIIHVVYTDDSDKIYDSRAVFEDIFINEDAGVYAQKDKDEQSIIWSIRGTYHNLYTTADITKEYLIKMAESVKYIQ